MSPPFLVVGDRVLLQGLTSEAGGTRAGQQLNGRLGKVTQLAAAGDELGRLEVSVTGSDRLLRLKPQNLQLQEVEDSEWAPGDQARLIGLEEEDKELQKLNCCLCSLERRVTKGKWLVKVQTKSHVIRCHNLRVCTQEECRRWGTLGPWPVRLCLSAVLTAAVLLSSELVGRRLHYLAGSSEVPGPVVASVPLLATLGSFLWILVTVAGCYRMHESLHDPEVRFPQISELAVGPPAAKMLYRLGFASSALLLLAVVQLHQHLALPHLPGGRGGEAGENFTYYGFCAACGVGLQGLLLLEPQLSAQTLAHLTGAMAFFYGAWCHMGAATRLYLPQGLPEDNPGYQEAQLALEEAADSQLLAMPAVQVLVFLRHKVLMRGPMLVFLVPLFSQLSERSGAGPAQSAKMRSRMGLAQWLVVLNFALIFLSYGPELAAAAYLPVPEPT
ncbi:unnamed protein product [Effrenium voratum]|nr:unnamed protein product [Effrenium voratum]